jgi:hypothetical protein
VARDQTMLHDRGQHIIGRQGTPFPARLRAIKTFIAPICRHI